MAAGVARMWPLERYARFTPEAQSAPLPQRPREDKKAGTWQHFSSKEGGIQMALLQSNHLMITSGTQIYESFSLWETGKWIKGVTKGDSILFIYRLKDENRRFRVKFLPTSSIPTSHGTCKDCVKALATLLPIRELGTSSSVEDSQMPFDDSQVVSQTQFPIPGMQNQSVTELDSSRGQQATSTAPQVDPRGGSAVNHPASEEGGARSLVGNRRHEEKVTPHEASLISVPELAKSLMTEGKPLGRAYADTNFPTDQIGCFVRLCLTDANFPGFVEAVEKELNAITTGK